MTLLLLVALQSMDHAAGERAGFVVAAPHEGYDTHTGPMAQAVAADLGWGWVVAEDYRSERDRRWFDVNRPTERAWDGDGFADAGPTDEAAGVYADYQQHVFDASGAEPLEMLVEIHGHARRVDGVLIEVIECSWEGFDTRDLYALKARYEDLLQGVSEEARVPLMVRGIDDPYEFSGREVRFYWTASGARETGSMRPECARRALHFELPPGVRREEETRAAYSRLLARLLEGL